MKKLTKLNSFWIRIIALATMTFDHIGVFFGVDALYPFRLIGRIALPLFIFLSVEGALKTSNKKKYILRLSAFAIGAAIVLTIFSFLSPLLKEIAYGSGNIFIDLLLIVLIITILESQNNKIKPLIALPIIYMIVSGVLLKLEGCACNGYYSWFPPGIRLQYGYYSLFLGMGFYLAKKIAPKVSPMCVDPEVEQIASNLLSILVLMISTVLFVGINTLFGAKYANHLDSVQTYAILAGVPILFYSGKKGYSAKWFKIAYYLYYPLHLVIIALIFM